jgi:parallel beta-helix repeat protein
MRTKIRTCSLVTVFAIGTVVTVNAANIPVTNLNDSGPGSFRQAIIDSNDEVTNPGLDVIDLTSIKNPNGPVVTIQPLTPLPPITSPVNIDGAINENRQGLPGDIILNEGAGFSLSGSGPSLRPGVELDGSVAITTSDADPAFYFFGWLQTLACDDLAQVPGERCYGTDPLDLGNPEIFVFDDENKGIKFDKARVNGLWVKDHIGSTIRGIVINRFSGFGIVVDHGGNHAIIGNYVGTDASGTMTGTEIGPAGAADTYAVADTDPASRTFGWIGRDELDSGDNTIAYGNGYPRLTNLAGAILGGLPGYNALVLANTSDNQVGGLTANDRNVVSGNAMQGISVVGNDPSFAPPDAPSDRNVIQGNFVGTGAFGNEPLGNATWGVILGTAKTSLILANDQSTVIGNVVSDNGYQGKKGGYQPLPADPPADGIGFLFATRGSVSHNHAGTDVAGTIALGNAGTGIGSVGSSQNVIEKNVASGNGLNGIESFPQAPRVDENLRLDENLIVRDNHIGTDITGMTPLGNGQEGILGIRQSQATYENNLISANGLSGISLFGGDNVVIEGNTIGANIDKSTSADEFANGAYGILSLGVTIAPLQGVPATNGQILDNFIANNTLAGITALFNEDLLIEGNTVANNGYANELTVPDFGVVDGAGNFGIEVFNQSARVEITNNWVGIDPSNPGNNTLGNANGGIVVGSVTFLQYYPSSGVPPEIVPQHLLQASVAGQPIGPTEVSVLENTVAYNGGSGVLVGGDVDDGVTEFCELNPTCYDVSAFLVAEFQPTPLPYDDGFPGDSMSVTILGNAIFSNDGLGIDLTKAHETVRFANQDVWTAVAAIPDGVTANDAADGDTGPNNLQNYPVLTSGRATGNHLKKIEGTLDSDPGHYRIEFFVNDLDDPSRHGEGQKLAGFLDVEFVGPGPHSFELTCNGVDLANGCFKVKARRPLQKLNLTATATNLDTGNTSEFSLNLKLKSKRSK